MPTNAFNAGVLDHQVAAADLGRMLDKLSQRPIEEMEMERDTGMELENRIAMTPRFATDFDTQQLGPASGFTCPDCNGSLATVGDDNFRCRVGHAWTPDSLLTARDSEVEGALWVALRSLQEKAKLARQMANRTNHGPLSHRYNALADEAEQALSVLSERLTAVAPHAEEQP